MNSEPGAAVLELEQSWKFREGLGVFRLTEALRVFHGPGEAAEGGRNLSSYAVDKFGDYYWITEWLSTRPDLKLRNEMVEFYRSKGAACVVLLSRTSPSPSQSSSHSAAKETSVGPEILFGMPPSGRFSVREDDNQFLIQFQNTRHPGLFLDHRPLRTWIQRCLKDKRVLNTFAYSGSLSVAANRGGARSVVSLDLSAPSVQWIKENLELNRCDASKNRLIAGDVFEWLPRFKREKEKFDCIILDPPSFSHGKKSNFSTAKDLTRLHALAMDVLENDGILITSINSANVSWKQYEMDILKAAAQLKMKFSIVGQIDLPKTFPTPLGKPALRYLKGWILKRG